MLVSLRVAAETAGDTKKALPLPHVSTLPLCLAPRIDSDFDSEETMECRHRNRLIWCDGREIRVYHGPVTSRYACYAIAVSLHTVSVICVRHDFYSYYYTISVRVSDFGSFRTFTGKNLRFAGATHASRGGTLADTMEKDRK